MLTDLPHHGEVPAAAGAASADVVAGDFRVCQGKDIGCDRYQSNAGEDKKKPLSFYSIHTLPFLSIIGLL